MQALIEQLRGGLIVSCQAGPTDAVYGSAAMAAMAQAAERGGAVGIRANGVEDIAAIRRAVSLPIIGIDKQDLPGYGIRITPSLDAARRIVAAGADIVAVDATRRGAEEGRLPAAQLIRQIKDELHVPVMADISIFEEAMAAAEAGADIVATTLSGYTSYSLQLKEPDFDLLEKLAHTLSLPVIAEGRISSPHEARHVLALGGFAVVVGSMITRPRWIVEQYVTTMQTHRHDQEGRMIALDIGGTKIAFAALERAPQLISVDEIPTQALEGGTAVLERVKLIIQRVLDQTGDAQAIGISTTGEVDASGRICYATNFMPGWQGIALRDEIQSHFGLPTIVENDAQAATYGEAMYGAGQGFSSVLGVTVGTGLGGGFVDQGKIYQGSRGAALILGHISVERNGRRCACGRRGCLESYVSGSALLADYNTRVSIEKHLHDGKEVMQAAQQGDAAALAAIQSLGDWLGYGLGIALNLFDPSVVIIGGGVAQIGDPFLDSVREAVSRYAYATVNETPVLAATLGTAAGLVGAASLARQHWLSVSG